MQSNQFMIQDMIQRQSDLNKISGGENWYSLPYWRAIWIECAELGQDLEWEWWKHKKININDIKLEIIDIWHFGLSVLIGKFRNDIKHLVDVIDKAFEVKYGATTHQIHLVEDIAVCALESNAFDLKNFVALCQSYDINLEQLYHLYIGKNVLNRFRQEHGYKQGSYIKHWGVDEDNVFLLLILDELGPNTTEQNIYSSLEANYKLVLSGDIE